MLTAQITLTEKESRAIHTMSESTGRTQDEILHNAITQPISQFDQPTRRMLLEQARGIWKDRDDFTDLETVRREFDRF